MQVNKKAADARMYSSGHTGVPIEESLAHDALVRKVKKKRRPKSSSRKPHQKRNSETFDSTKFRRGLIRSIGNSSKKGKATRHSRNPSHFGNFSRVGIRSSTIISIIICTVLMTSAYASLGSNVLSGDLTKVMNDMLSFTKNNNGNYRSQVARDHTPPAISGLKDLVVEATGVLTLVPLAAPSVTDNVDPVLIVTNNASFSGYPLGTSGIMWTAKDDAGNIATALQKLTLVDTTPPIIMAPSDVVVNVDSSTYLTQLSLGSAYAKDAVDSSPFIVNDAPVDGFPLGTSTVTWSATDSSGNSATDTQLVSASFNTNPNTEVSTPDTISTANTNSSTDTTSSLPTETSPSISGSYSGGGGGGGGSGSTSSPDPSSNPGTITDSTPPTIIPPPYIFANAAGPLTLVILGLPTVSDTQDPNPTVTNNAPANGFPVGTTIVTWKATDYSGNHGTALQNIVIEDKSPPLLVAPSNIVAEATGVKTSVSLGTPIVSDLADLSPFVSNDAPLGYGIGSSTVTWKAKDASGNTVTAAQTVTIVDTTSPTIVAPVDIMINSTGALTSISIGSAIVNDRVDPSPLVTNNAPANGFPVGKTIVTWTATDASGNSAADTQIVAVINAQPPNPIPSNNPDVIPPTIIAPPDVITDATGLLTQVVLGMPTVTDLEDPSPKITNDAPANGFLVGKTIVTWTATDASGNYAKAAQLVTIQSTTAYTIPTIGGVRPTAVTYGSTVHTVCKTGCNYTSISSAIDALPADGGKIIVKGQLWFPTTVNLRSNLVIEFEAGASVIHSASNKIFSGDKINNVMFINPVITQFSAPHDAIYITNGNNIIVKGGIITGVKGGPDNDKSDGFECRSCKNVLVENGKYLSWSRPIATTTLTATRDGTSQNIWIEKNTVSDGSAECTRNVYGLDVHVNFNDVRDCGNNGIDVGFDLGVEVRNNVIVHAGFGTVNNAVGIHTDSANIVVLVGNTIDLSGTNGISLCSSDNNFVVANTIRNSGQVVTETIFKSDGHGIEVIKCQSTNNPENTIIDRNTITGSNDGYGVFIGNGATNTSLTNNTLSGNERGPYFNIGTGTTISGNIVN
ncbi:MAG: hypothetical protein AUH84_07885 [Thaumarchaeota archaeon 13_1_40CM_4_38_7]|nr:MAG: hypothetical protein AUH84_07885 [Thaumarchaeota archaeon 13_1_40CM_4_38_7]